MNVKITLTTAGTDTGPFNLYSNTDSYVTAFQTNIAKSLLVAGYTSTVVPAGTTTVRVKSTGTCTTYVDLFITGSGTTTTTTTAHVGPTTTTTTTAVGPTTTTTTTTQVVTYYNVVLCGTSTPSVIRHNGPNNVSTGVVVQSSNGQCYTISSVGTGPETVGTLLTQFNNCVTCQGAPPPTTTTTTTASPTTTTTTTTALVQQWYQITNCATLATTTTAAYSVGQFAINDRVNDLSSNVYTITATYSSNPGGAGLFIGSLGATGCPSGTTTTTTQAPSVATNILVEAVTSSGPDQDCLGTLYPVTRTTVTATLYNQYGATMNAASNITVVVNSTYDPCYGGSIPTTYNITINAGQSSGSVNWDSVRTVDCGQSNCIQETDTYNCAASNTASLPFRAGTVTC
jgi:hypothetical protein